MAPKEKLNNDLVHVCNDLKAVISYFDWIHIVNISTTSNRNTITKIERIQNLKLLELFGEKMHHDPDVVIRNYWSHALSDIEKALLVKALNYALPPKKLKYEDYLLPFELLYRDIKDDEAANQSLIHLKSRLRDIGLSTYRLYNKKDYWFENLSREEYEAFLNV